MKVTVNWLKSFVDVNDLPEELVAKLTMLGLEVDALEKQNWDFDGIIIGEVTQKEGLRDADHLWVCQVDVGKERLPIVCGAPNVEVGQKVPVALAGTTLPGGQKIEKTRIRGADSYGMICSEAELGISSRGDGIMILNSDARVGSRLAEVLGRGEIVIDIDVTPNRPDCLGVIGVAREIAAVSRTQLRKPEVSVPEEGPAISELISIEVLDPDRCPRYMARFIGHVSIGPSPSWLAMRLEAVGIRSINNVVDVTNFVMMETGQPLHAFDYDLLSGQKIVVKTASEGERFTTLDEKTHTLSRENLMICDGQKPVAVGGVMGGVNSEVSEKTQNVLLECAYFDPLSIRRTAKQLGISSESSRRFERGTDPNGLPYALDRATQLIAETAGGQVARGAVDVYPKRIHPVTIHLRPQRLRDILGNDISAEDMTDILARLEFRVAKNGDLQVEVPTFRPDITREADLIEEVARVHGYENIPADTRASIEQLRTETSNEWISRRFRDTLLGLGFSEVVTYAMTRRRYAELFLSENGLVELTNPLSEDFTTLRTSLLPGLLNAIAWNINRKNTDVRIFELGRTFRSANGPNASVIEKAKLGGAVTGRVHETSWAVKPQVLNLYHLKGSLEVFLTRNHIRDWRFGPVEINFLTREALAVYLGEECIGYLGRLSRTVTEVFGVEQPVYGFELDFEALLRAAEGERLYQPVPRFPPVLRDLAVIVDSTLDVEKVRAEIEAAGREHLRDVKLFDVYTGEQVASGRKSLAFSLTFYSFERTLTEDEVDAEIENILERLRKAFGAKLRS